MTKLWAAVAAVRRDVGAVAKSAENTHHKYNYQPWGEVLAAVKAACEKNGLLILPETVCTNTFSQTDSKGKDKTSILAEMRFHLIHVESGESFTLEWVGEGQDTQDKALNKAGTAGYKYFLLKLFMITTDDEKDPDGDGSPARKVVVRDVMTEDDLKTLMDLMNDASPGVKKSVGEQIVARFASDKSESAEALAWAVAQLP